MRLLIVRHDLDEFVLHNYRDSVHIGTTSASRDPKGQRQDCKLAKTLSVIRLHSHSHVQSHNVRLNRTI